MDKLNIGFLVSSVLATTGLGVYVYMNSTDNDNDTYNETHNENINNEYSKADTMLNDEENEHDYIKSNKKSLAVKTKRRTTKNTGTRRKR